MESVFYSRMCGKLLGDGSIVQQKGRKPRFQFIHRREDEQWALHCYDQLKAYIPLAVPFHRKMIDSRVKKGYTESVMVQSKTYPLLTELRKRWYPDGTKQLPFDFIHTYLDDEALAWWYQDDGHLNLQDGMMRKIVLSTDSFTHRENLWLIQLLNDRFQLRFSMDSQNRILLYDTAQIICFLEIVTPFLQTCMERKACRLPPIKPIAKRTTIYLPQEIKLIRPTQEINSKLQALSHFYNPTTEIPIEDSVTLHILAKRESPLPVKAYQICIEDEFREMLAKLRQLTGLTISELVIHCFAMKEVILVENPNK